MNRKNYGERGMSLVEVTIILMVLAVVTAVAAPSINDYVQDARDVKVKEDVEAIGTSITRLLRDTGKPMLLKVEATGLVEANRVDLLVSEGKIPSLDAGLTSYANTNLAGNINWDLAATHAQADTMLNQFVINTPVYAVPTQAIMIAAGGGSGIGWRGGYLSNAIGPDPWGNRYAANTAFLAAATDSTNEAVEGVRGWSNAVIVISAGRNAILTTSIQGLNGGSAIATVSDDVFYVVSGNSR